MRVLVLLLCCMASRLPVHSADPSWLQSEPELKGSRKGHHLKRGDRHRIKVAASNAFVYLRTKS